MPEKRPTDDDGTPVFVVWRDEYSVGCDPIDDQHKRIVAILNDFYVAIQEGNDADILTGVLQRLVDYAREHFAFEEHVMKEHEYPDLAKHQMRHLAMKDKTCALLKQRPNVDHDTPAEVFRFLKDWWITHILHEDKLYAPYLTPEADTRT